MSLNIDMSQDYRIDAYCGADGIDLRKLSHDLQNDPNFDVIDMPSGDNE